MTDAPGSRPSHGFWDRYLRLLAGIVIGAAAIAAIVVIFWEQTSLTDDYQVQFPSNIIVTRTPTSAATPGAVQPTPPAGADLADSAVRPAGSDTIFVSIAHATPEQEIVVSVPMGSDTGGDPSDKTGDSAESSPVSPVPIKRKLPGSFGCCCSAPLEV